MTDQEQIMADYRAAYLAANGREAKISYRAGWYTVGEGQSKWRLWRVKAATDVLNSRAEQKQQAGD